MTVREMIEALEDMAATHGDDTDVWVCGATDFVVKYNTNVDVIVAEEYEPDETYDR